MKLIELINEKLILVGLEERDNHDAIKVLGNRLLTEGYVKDTFIDAAIQREKEYPTGIQGVEINIAIPHTENTHVINPGVAIGVLKEEVLFNKMDNPDERIKVKIIFLLAIKMPELHLEALKEIMNIVQDAEMIKAICVGKDSKEIINIIGREDK
ncbi:MAG: PTS sugar transporter subunit IIA [Lutispora sp.]|nr:PTS sugar transporter subunit IIA [Lutispora sp.]